MNSHYVPGGKGMTMHPNWGIIEICAIVIIVTVTCLAFYVDHKIEEGKKHNGEPKPKVMPLTEEEMAKNIVLLDLISRDDLWK
jgi:hypothetical protein